MLLYIPWNFYAFISRKLSGMRDELYESELIVRDKETVREKILTAPRIVNYCVSVYCRNYSTQKLNFNISYKLKML